MLRKLIFIILIICSVNLYSQEEIIYNWKLNLDLSIDPLIEDIEFSRGITFGVSRKLVDELYFTFSSRFINGESNYLSLLVNYDIILGRFVVPLNIGAGGSIYEIDLEDLNFHYTGKTGLEFIVNDTFNYALSIALIYPIFNDKDYIFYGDLGIRYRF